MLLRVLEIFFPQKCVKVRMHSIPDIHHPVSHAVSDLLLDVIEAGGVFHGRRSLPVQGLGFPVENIQNILLLLNSRRARVKEASLV